jgi:penicillin-binding protein 1A
MVLYTMVGKKQGGSTITQQLALNLFGEEREKNRFRRIIQKLQEWIVAVKLERSYTKEEIITMYLNTVPWGSYNTYGINSASLTYFNVTPDKLSPGQAALLIGMLKGPTIYSPIRHPENALRRRNLILGLMADQGYISQTEASRLQQKPLGIQLTPLAFDQGPAPYFRSVLKRDIQNILRDQSRLKADGTLYDLDRDGLKIYTTIDLSMQKYAEQAQQEYLKELQKQFDKQWHGRNPFHTNKLFQQMLDRAILNSERYAELRNDGMSRDEILTEFRKPVPMSIFTWKGPVDTVMRPIDSIMWYKMTLRNAMMSMEPNTGYVRAWVGGNNFQFFKYDQVKQGTRQVGSTAKPFTYAVAIGPNNRYSPCYLVPNEPITIEGYGAPWTPRAYKPKPGPLTLKTALAFSQNYVTARVMNMIGPTSVRTLIKEMGITSNVQPVPSICLGTFDASLYDMVGAYSTFVNHGVWTKPIYLLRIEDRNGNVLYENETHVKNVLDPSTAYAMVDMLKGVVREGTGARLGWKYGFTNPIGGKTGTTQENSDGWFIGITPKLVTGVWTGFEERWVHFSSTDQGEGSNSALPVFALYMKQVYADPKLHYPKTDFEVPDNLDITIDCNAYTSDSTAAATPDPKLKF